MKRESGRSKEIHLSRGMSFVSSTFKRMSFASEQVNRKLVHQLLKTSALHFSALLGNPDIVAVFLQHLQINVNMGNPIGKTALHFAIEGGHYYQVVRLLLDHPDIEVTSRDYFGWTPLHLAALRVRGHLLTLGFLLGHFKTAGINVKDKSKPILHQSIWFGEYTALHCGVLGGSAGPSVLRLVPTPM